MLEVCEEVLEGVKKELTVGERDAPKRVAKSLEKKREVMKRSLNMYSNA